MGYPELAQPFRQGGQQIVGDQQVLARVLEQVRPGVVEHDEQAVRLERPPDLGQQMLQI